MRKWLVIDVSYMCHRAFYTTARQLSWNGHATGVIFSFLKQLVSLKEELQATQVTFAFDHPHLLRRDLCPFYKARRHAKEKTAEEAAALGQLYAQVNALRTTHLPKMGFKNIFYFDGMESDDIMAALPVHYPKDYFVLLTADCDLYQCLNDRVCLYSPTKQKYCTVEWFERSYGIPPEWWAEVKAIGGCVTDEIKGVDGVGELTALKFLRGQLSPTNKAWRSITSPRGVEVRERNRRLVELPLAECPRPPLQEDHVDAKGWREVCGDLGMWSLAGRSPW